MIKENERLLTLFRVLVDAGILIGAFVLSYYLRFDDVHSPLIQWGWIHEPIGYYSSLTEYMQCLFVLVPAYIVSYFFFRLYDPKRVKSRKAELAAILAANIVGIVIVTATLFFYRRGVSYARLFIVIFVITNTFLSMLVRFWITTLVRKIRRSGHNKKHILLVGYSRTAEGYIDRLKSNPEWGYMVHGILDDSMDIGHTYRGMHVIGRISDLPKLLEKHDFDEIIITLAIDHLDRLEKIVSITENSGAHTKFVPDYNNIIPTRPYTEDLDGLPVIHVRKVPLSMSFNRLIKRIMDIIGSLLLIILTSIPMLIIAIIVKATSPGPLIFKQKRIGLHNKPFMMYKFRSMKMQDEESERQAWTVKDDPRVTKIGKFIRKTSLDEFPQFFNVLSGKMSLVGPRPERPQFVEKFREEIPRYMIKHQVRPGITGWAQVNGYRGDTSITKRIEYDLYYVENWSVGLDIKILALTLVKGFVNKNAY
ncbi:MAG: undecaprenyl-phosphate glucose phosphotransferase [Eubacterium sp.]|nr:undecaprenyl-phosphate glucose phosphotransferase [Eubacterium sp.]